MAGGFPELLAPRGGTHSEAEAVALARFPGALYLWSGGGHSRNCAAGEVDIFADQEKRTQHCPESMVVNSLGLWLALLSGLVILAAVSPKHQTLQSKLMYPDAKCLSS